MDKDNLKAIITEILMKGHTLSLGTVDDAGVWVANVVYVFDEELNLFWMSSPKVRHSIALSKNPKVAASITISNSSKIPNLGIQLSGTAQAIGTARLDLAKMHAAKRSAPEPTEDQGFLQGRLWYQLTPERIDIINEELWGFKKQTLEM